MTGTLSNQSLGTGTYHHPFRMYVISRRRQPGVLDFQLPACVYVSPPHGVWRCLYWERAQGGCVTLVGGWSQSGEVVSASCHVWKGCFKDLEKLAQLSASHLSPRGSHWLLGPNLEILCRQGLGREASDSCEEDSTQVLVLRKDFTTCPRPGRVMGLGGSNSRSRGAVQATVVGACFLLTGL